MQRVADLFASITDHDPSSTWRAWPRRGAGRRWRRLGWLIAGRFLRPLRTITATARDISASNLHRRLGHRRARRRVHGTRRDPRRPVRAAGGVIRRRSGTSSPTPPTNCAPRSPRNGPCCRSPSPTRRPPPSRCAPPARRRCNWATSRNASSTRCSPWPAASGASNSWEPFDLADIAANAIRDSAPRTADRRGIRIDSDLAAAPATGDPALVESLVANLVDNAIRHNVAGGWVEVSTAITDGRAVRHGPQHRAADPAR